MLHHEMLIEGHAVAERCIDRTQDLHHCAGPSSIGLQGDHLPHCEPLAHLTSLLVARLRIVPPAYPRNAGERLAARGRRHPNNGEVREFASVNASYVSAAIRRSGWR